MATLKQRLHRKNLNGYDIIHIETDATVVQMSPDDSTSVSTKINNIDTEMNTVKTSVSNGKSLIASAITDKGVSTASDATFQVMADNILALQTKPTAPEQFGDGSDGEGLFTSDTVWTAETEDTGMIIKNFETLTIAREVTVSAGNRNCGMIVRVIGDCTIHGTLANRMSCKTLLDSDNVDFSMWPLTLLSGKAGDGGTGGVYYTSGDYGGTGMTGRFYGGGWSGGGCGGGHQSGMGGATATGDGGSAANITTAISTIFVAGIPRTTSNAGTYGGGGAGASANQAGGTGGSGAGGSGVTAQSTTDGYNPGGGGGGAGNYGGGVIILLVGGNLLVDGTIDCSGCVGGAGGNGGDNNSTGYGDGNSYGGNGGNGGGGGGGGRIFICYKGSITNTGTLDVSGGAGGAAGKGGSSRRTAVVGKDGVSGDAGTDGNTYIKTYTQYLEDDVS